ncbi:MAG TPA: RluA family pseudouridine synthase [Actinomycetaceae bacterium]|nr:RluA family pseudouridine synthase [Actinomycetaceae bacterium]
MSEQRQLPVPEGLAGERADVALGRLLGFSRNQAAELLGSGGIRQDGEPLAKSDRLRAGSWLEIDMPAPREAAPREPAQGLVVRYEDDDLLVVDKPVGVAVHASPGWLGPTVVDTLAASGYQLARSGPAERQGVVHRLDVGTSGVMLLAKSEVAYVHLKDAFRQRTVTRVYHAVVQGHMDPLRGTIDAPIGRHPGADYRFAVIADGKHAVTHYDTLEAMPGASLLEVRLETGRTHQIRVHASAMRHPCVGDLTYGADPVLADKLGLRRQWLHAMRLQVAHPTSGDLLEVTSSYPADLDAALQRLRAGTL